MKQQVALLKKTIQYATVSRANELLITAPDAQTAMGCIEKYNDAYGHNIGDLILKEFAKILEEVLRI